jgi:hypothetical protein
MNHQAVCLTLSISAPLLDLFPTFNLSASICTLLQQKFKAPCLYALLLIHIAALFSQYIEETLDFPRACLHILTTDRHSIREVVVGPAFSRLVCIMI